MWNEACLGIGLMRKYLVKQYSAMGYRWFVALALSALFVPGAYAQTVPTGVPNGVGPNGLYTEAPAEYEVKEIKVEGADTEAVASYVRQVSGLQVGQTVTVPGDPALSDAIRNIYAPGLFSDVKIATEKTDDGGINLVLRVQEEPKLNEFRIEGVKKGDREDLQKQMSLLRGRPVRPTDIEQAKRVIQKYYGAKGFALTEVDVRRNVNDAANTVDLTLVVNRGERVRVGDVRIEGNSELSDRSIARRLKNTREGRWWRFWKKSKFNEDKLEEDLQAVLDFYRERGYYDARIVRDSVYIVVDNGSPRAIVELEVHEGKQYHIRNIDWEGNTVYSDEVLTQALGFKKGDVYNQTKLQQNLFANKNSSDVASLYMNRGYMRFNAEPTIRVVAEDSIDISFDVTESDIYTFGNIDIQGNDKTKEHVIRRELYTIPGQTFSRSQIQESIRRLAQLNYFNQESLTPTIEVDEQNKEVDLTYNVEEVGSDQLELSGTWGRYGLILMLRFGFNNFSAQNIFNPSAWRPLPSGDGQKLSVGIQTNGSYYQNYSISFTEPWYRGRPTPVGFSLSHSRMGSGIYGSYYFRDREERDDGSLITTSARAFYQKRLNWPDDYFTTGTSIGYQYYLNNLDGYRYIPEGLSQEVSIEQTLSRSSIDNPMFPMSGSEVALSLKVAPPIPGFIQYHKWRFKSSWNVPLANKISFGFGTDLGYVGSLTGDPVEFGLFDVGGSPFDAQGYYTFGTDLIYMRGYPRSAITPRDANNNILGGRVLNKFTSEIRWLAVQSPQIQAAPYIFMDAANTWTGLSTYNPAELYRSAGVGVRLFLPIVGMLELTYGYNFDRYPLVNSATGELSDRKWYFQFSLGQSFGN